MVCNIEGQRIRASTIVFDVSGIIDLSFVKMFPKPYFTLAGQTAPGKGICLRASDINIASDAATAISQQPSPVTQHPIVKRDFFTLDGRQVSTMQSHETYIMRTTDSEGHQQSVKIIKN